CARDDYGSVDYW
nr:immunoglobulin heavy chain junction region [Macaca mulatta]MOV42466.1 immunoglobulin heavy chain junction region [Macaca mulatta]